MHGDCRLVGFRYNCCLSSFFFLPSFAAAQCKVNENCSTENLRNVVHVHTNCMTADSRSAPWVTIKLHVPSSNETMHAQTG